jgi:hypothetical protein
MTTADSVLGKADKIKHEDWFDACMKCCGGVCIARREEKRIHKKKWKCNEDKLQKYKYINESRALYQELNKSQRDFNPTVIFYRDKKGAIVSGKDPQKMGIAF